MVNTLETEILIKCFSKEIENIKENQMDILELKNTKIRNSLDGHSGRMEMTEEETVSLKLGQYKLHGVNKETIGEKNRQL